MTDRLETVILLTGQTVKAAVQELGFHYNNFLAKYDNHKLVWKGNCWMVYQYQHARRKNCMWYINSRNNEDNLGFRNQSRKVQDYLLRLCCYDINNQNIL